VIAHLGIILAVAATFIYNLGFILEKRALGHLPAINAHHAWQLLRTLFTAPAWLAGFVLICAGLALQALVLSLVPLTIAQPLQASGVVVTIVLSRLMLHERLGRTELACMGVIAVAVLLLALSSGRGPGAAAGTHAAGMAVAAAAIPAFLVALVIYWWTHRASGRRHPVTGLSYGLCAGLMYGVAGLALKALSAAVFTARATPRPPTAALAIHTVARGKAVLPHPPGGLLVTAALSPYLYLVLACSAVGMCLFQTALQRSPASIVLPISAIISIGYLVVIGSWLFHERLPVGPVPLAMRLVGGVAAVAVPVILTVMSERATRRRLGGLPHHRQCPGAVPSHGKAPSMSLDPLLLNLLACPIDKQALLYLAEDEILYNPRLRRRYCIRDGIPVMLAEQGETMSDDRHRDLLRRVAAGGAQATLQAAVRDVLAGAADAGTLLAPSPARLADQAAIILSGRAVREGKTGSGEDAA
jgi:uncharacterized protein YbaR (Trm112 family)/drug/metabolite transporter (DMT)-like permease